MTDHGPGRPDGTSLREGELKALADLKARLLARLGSRLEAFRLFGSRARGEAEPESDLDVAILVRGLTSQEKHTLLGVVAEVELDHLQPLAALVMSAEEFAERRRRERRLALDIEAEGIPL